MKKPITILVICLLTFTSCDQEQPQLRLTSTERVKVDTLFTQQIKAFRAHLDSLCDANREELIQLAVDSIIKVRREEERRLRARILRENNLNKPNPETEPESKPNSTSE